MIPSRIGPYKIVRLIGAGGMGAVYRGTQVRLQRQVAIKIMCRDQGRDHGFEERFRREALALAQLNHPNIVNVIDYGEAGPDYLYIVMEFVGGTTLTNWQAAQKHSWQEILRMYCAAGQGLLAAHLAQAPGEGTWVLPMTAVSLISAYGQFHNQIRQCAGIFGRFRIGGDGFHRVQCLGM